MLRGWDAGGWDAGVSRLETGADTEGGKGRS